MLKKITDIHLVSKDEIFKISNYVKANGGPRTISVIGTPGAIFSLTMDDIDGCDVLKSPIKDVSIPKTGK